MRKLILILVLMMTCDVLAEDDELILKSTVEPSQQPPEPIYKSEPPMPYIPLSHPYLDGYAHEGYYPQHPISRPNRVQEQPSDTNYVTSLIPATQSALQLTLRVLAKFGLFLIGGSALLLVGGIFTMLICTVTPICVISFPGASTLNKETVRSLMTPEKISAAAALLQDAIGKYQTLQRTVNNK